MDTPTETTAKPIGPEYGHGFERDRWRNRRRMAWLAMWASIGYPVLLIAQADGVALAQIAGPFYLFTGAVVGAYIGFATWEDKGKV